MKKLNNILVVEDDETIRMSLQELLESEGYPVTSTHNGADALEWMKKNPNQPSLILLDLMMPVMDGKAFLEEAKNSLPDFHTFPVCLLTAAGKSEIPAVDDQVTILRKPIEVGDLLKVVDRFCVRQ